MKGANIVENSSQAIKPTTKAISQNIWTGIGGALPLALDTARILASNEMK
jgi:hypothetical protein